METPQEAVAAAQDAWHLTFTSASSSLLTNWPAMAAEGPWTHHSIGISSRLAALLKTWPADASLGTVVMDFPGYPEIQICPAIIARNLAS